MLPTMSPAYRKQQEGVVIGGRYAQGLKRHMLTHTAERPHVCQQCGKSFALKGTLNVHMQQHSTSRTFKCYKCGEVFARKQEMKSHICSQTNKDASPAKSGSAEYCVLSKASVYMTYDNVTSRENKGSTDEPVARLVPDVLDDIASVTTLISDGCMNDIAPVAGLVSNHITNTVTPVGNLVTEVNSEMVPLSKTVTSNNYAEVPYETQFSNEAAENSDSPQNMEDTYEDDNLLASTSHLPNANQTDVLSQAYAVVDENVVTDCVNLHECSVLETNQEPEVNENTIYTLVTIDSEVEQPTLITIPTVSNSGSEENVTLQINFPEDGCSEVFIIKG
ncbi:uncharacterized protein [Panulirus ornatus]|uniref:uncharacterized protein isoform X2 n=1 Tax=Panulirus ornatus TaxID=150431 RepID=UPI003A89B9A4